MNPQLGWTDRQPERVGSSPMRFWIGFCLWCAWIGSLAGCETAVDPFQPSDRYFSIGGVIDASVDTQFVRLTPLRRGAAGDTSGLDVEVTTTDLLTGETAQWHDSVFSVSPSGFVHNVWSSERFVAGRSYRFDVRDTAGRQSSAVVALPDTFPDLTVQIPPFSSTATINVLDVENLVDLRLLFCGREQEGGRLTRVDVSLIEQASSFGQGYTVRVGAYELAREMGLVEVSWIRILAMAAGPGWPDFANIDEETMALPDVISNIQNGVGFLGGVTSRLAHWPQSTTPSDEECYELLRRW